MFVKQYDSPASGARTLCKRGFSLFALAMFVLCLCPAPSYAQQSLVLNRADIVFPLPSHLFEMQDPDRKYSERMILERFAGFMPNEAATKILHTGMKNAPLWMVFRVKNDSDTDNWLLDFGDVLDGRQGLIQRLYVRNTSANHVIIKQFGEQSDSGGDAIHGTGIALNLPRGQEHTIVMYMEFEGTLTNSFAPRLVSQKFFMDALRVGDLRSNLVKAGFIGVIGFFILTTVLRRWSSALFAGGYFAAAAGLYYLLQGMFLTGDIMSGSFLAIFLYVGMIFALLMTHSFFNIAADDTAENILTFATAGFLVVTLLIYLLIFSANYIFDDVLLFFSLLAANGAICLVAATHARKGGFEGWLFLLSFLLLMGGFVGSGFSGAGLLDLNLHCVNAYWYALAVQAGLLMTASVLKHSSVDHEAEANFYARQKAERAKFEQQRIEDKEDQARLLRVIERERELMTELREREMQRTEEMRMAKDSADEANQAKSAFLAVVSHEIRTPMTGIMGMLKLLLNTQMTKEQREYAEAVQNSGDTMVALLNDILDFEKIESGSMELEEIPCDMPKLVQGIVTLMGGHAAEKGLKLSTKISDNFPEYLAADPTRLRQVLLNLVNNAIKFTGDGAVTLHLEDKGLVTREGKGAAHCVYFAIEDTGIGMSAEAQGKLFTPFAQAEKSTTRKYGGTGLGLAICKRLVEAMGGEISVHSEEGEGSTFYFEAYFEPIQNGATDAAEAPVHALAQEAPLPGGKILVIEDNEMNQKVLEGFLSQDNHKVSLAGSGEQALRKMEVQGFDVVLCDINLGDMNGMDITRKIRNLRNADAAKTPVIAVTGNISDADIEQYYAANMNGFIAKPIDQGKLNALVRDAMAGKLEQAVKISSSASGGIGDGYADLSGIDLMLEDDAPEPTTEAPQTVQKPVSIEQDVMDFEMFETLKTSLGDEVFNELIGGFWETAEAILERLKTADQSADASALKNAAHELKGMAGNFGFKEIAEVATVLEAGAGEDAPDLGVLHTMIEKLPEAYRKGRAATQN
ncbi:MAG: ATP-binding protein [Alphaproteobacteria bacterium]